MNYYLFILENNLNYKTNVLPGRIRDICYFVFSEHTDTSKNSGRVLSVY